MQWTWQHMHFFLPLLNDTTSVPYIGGNRLVTYSTLIRLFSTNAQLVFTSVNIILVCDLRLWRFRIVNVARY
jgi:hypothetical protein